MTALPTSGSFTRVDASHVAEVGPAAAILFARIAWRSEATGEWQATRGQMSAETGLSTAMIRTAVEVLRDREWVTARRTSADDATLIWTPVLAGQAESAKSAISTLRIPQGGVAESAMSSLETVETSTSSSDEVLFAPVEAPAPPLRSVPKEADLDAEFDRFWSLYPRRTAKKAARAAYGRARRTATVAQIAAGLRAQLPSMIERVEAGDAQYVPHPTTWLNQGRWEDEAPAARPSPQASGQGYDPTYAATLPPPRTDPFARGVL